MQAVSAPASSPSFDAYEFNNMNIQYSQLSANFAATVKVSEDDVKEEITEIEAQNDVCATVHEEEIEEEEEEEFSFFCTNPDGSPISADDVFQDGQIRPVYPIFNRDLLFADAYDGDSSRRDDASPSLRPPLKKFFFEDRDAPSSSASESDELEALPEGSYCEWSKNAKEVSPELRNNKSNSTGSSKLWRIRDLVPRSNSDGKDAFVFLSPNSAAKLKQNKDAAKAKAVEKAQVKDKGQKGKKAETVSSAHERHYVMNRAKKEGEKRRSYLPYRPGVVGFFTNVNVLSKNVHPF
ncbi:PREDICTED: uncharacterized protein LOC101307982 [Fragaria vesca subsp. vesca]|uniref:uncharacterized protein LOC101307982 n=1 Tax=Fragaria vesca subsp. vesca TaxID=101020 RepID=UPI0002C2F553|nr:PREDICTED: uncharacterized protein LOC101307982 [Fragaria vesca subsp. vesca]